MIKLLFIEDDATLGYIMQSSLEEIIGGYEVKWVTNGKDGLKMLAEFKPDVIVSDIEMPFMDGKEMVQKIRSSNNRIPIIFASGKIMPEDVTGGYNAGADFYVKKPFQPEEIDAHIKSALKFHINQPERNEEIIYRLGKYTFYPKQYFFENESKKHSLTLLESNILTMLCENTGKVVLRTDILNKYWPTNYDYASNSRSLDVFVRKLRTYLSDEQSVSITTIKKVGLRLDVNQ